MLAALADLVRDVTRRVRGVRLRPRARAHRAVLLGLLRRLPRAGEAARVRHDRRERRGLRARRARDRAVDVAAAVRAVPLLRDRRGLVVVAGRLGAPRSRGRRPTTPRALAGERAALDYAVAAEVLGAVRKVKSEARRSMRAEVTRVVRHRHARAARGARRASPPTSAAPARSPCSTPIAGDAFAVEVELPEEPAA